MKRPIPVAALVAALAAGPVWADARTVIGGITYEAVGSEAGVDAEDGIVRLALGGATVTVTRGGTFIGVARVAARPRDSLRLMAEGPGLSVAVDGVVVWRGDAG